jgi:glycosyltransferase involved in cell wall biosynthesis
MPKTNLPTVTVGIPAYNEEQNIGYLLLDILNQETVGFVVEKIIVNSDGSHDRTARIAKILRDQRIEVRDDGLRKGLAARQNEMIRANRSEILILLNADILLEGKDFFAKLLSPLLDGSADFASSNLWPLKPESFMERVLAAGFLCKNSLFEIWNHGKNVYTCHGAARAFNRAYLKDFAFPQSVGEDAYSFFYGLKKNFRYGYSAAAIARVKLPETLSDHFNQNGRFHQSKRLFRETFGEATVRTAYRFPRLIVMRAVFLACLREPVFFPIYLALYTFSWSRAVFPETSSQTWETAMSSKKLR